MSLDLSKPPTPPPAVKRQAATSQRRQSVKTEQREEALNGLFGAIALACVMMKQPADAGAISTMSPPIAHEAAVIAETNDGFAKTLDYISAAGPYATLAATCMPLVLQILVNHNRLPAEPLAQFGVSSPDAIAAQVRAEAMRKQSELMREQSDAERELAAMMKERELAAMMRDAENDKASV